MSKHRKSSIDYEATCYSVRVAFEGRHPFANGLFCEAFGEMPFDYTEGHHPGVNTLLTWVFQTRMEAREAHRKAKRALAGYYGFALEADRVWKRLPLATWDAYGRVLLEKEEAKRKARHDALQARVAAYEASLTPKQRAERQRRMAAIDTQIRAAAPSEKSESR